MKKKNVFNQTITLVLAAMLLMVAGVKSSSVAYESLKNISSVEKSGIFGHTQDVDAKVPDSEQTMVSSLALDAVITPALSFDFAQFFYFLSPAVWHFVERGVIVRFSYIEPLFLISGFGRIFGTCIVTNAP